MDQLVTVPAAWALAAGVALALLTLWAVVGRRRRPAAVRARVVAKRSATYGRAASSPGVYTAYFATFELADGERLELAVPDSAYGLLVEGDEGVLDYTGTRWRGFDRKSRAKAAGRRRTARSR